MKRQVIHLDETPSTNDYIRLLPLPQQEVMTVVTAEYQTAGRGQGINRWESDRGCNILCSIRVTPLGVEPARQFLLSEAGALAVAEALDEYAEGFALKWPNDIYWHDRKICGTLIETAIAGGRLRSCVFGIGLNVNQQTFNSDAPNPVSLRQIIGRVASCDAILENILLRMDDYLNILRQGRADEVATRYHRRLYRREGYHPYRDSHGVFQARIVRVDDAGPITLCDTEGRMRQYAFKEVQFVV